MTRTRDTTKGLSHAFSSNKCFKSELLSIPLPLMLKALKTPRDDVIERRHREGDNHIITGPFRGRDTRHQTSRCSGLILEEAKPPPSEINNEAVATDTEE
ncbi:uncharacterized protein N7473_011471 [Penicillium subrubescens]|uniref:uncharacterized protein n=1 Tax=Penicillium subrubescens TaxID=1316194 RepID=UPI002545365F|nr:uncharacterized protein N7473_011471 [Penicillium subrubescens]KAJ5880418.1 hypothetical protein N7473_011471 [Penicillium subrubescens]